MPRTARILIQNATMPISRVTEAGRIVKGKRRKKEETGKKTARATLTHLRSDVSS